MKKQTKILSLILAVVMIMSVMPMTANATSTNEHNTAVPEGYIGVYTIEDLYCVRNDLTANYILMNDIDLSEATAEGGDWNYGGRGWNPIGSDDAYSAIAFNGIFNGNGYSIKGMNIEISKFNTSKTNYYVGLFASVSGIVKNLTVDGKIKVNLCLTAKYSDSKNVYVGGISGFSSCGVFENCINKTEIIVNEELSATGRSYIFSIGGIVGRTDSMTEDSYANKTHVSRCINTGKITANVSNYYEEYNYIAGIVGYSNRQGAIIEKCINVADIYAGATPKNAYFNHLYASGIANANSANILNCYNTANIASDSSSTSGASSYSAGISAIGAGISFCYNIGFITASHYDYPIGAINSTNKPTGKSYYLGSVGTSQINDYYTELTNGQMKLKSMYSGWDFDTIWTMDGREDYPYPELRNTALFFPGESTEHEHTYTSEITTPATHLTEGVMTYTCTCGDSYTEVIAKTTEHTYNAVITAPTCTDQGYTTFTCACGDTYVADYVNANEHSHTANVTTPATHITEGVMTYTCACGDTYTESIAKTIEHTYDAVVIAPTCTVQGYTKYICDCGDSYESDLIDVIDHADADNDYLCDDCGAELYKDSDDNHDAADNCSHICHKTGFLGFFAKIALFFWKLFGTNPVCECGMAHY